ncbi:hypothetical protein GEX40_22270 [Salmonella enterica]|nr:hypothetical protein [Salmonella enterica]EDJ9484767.1 hypothetical protein [Salmonella enterica]EDL1787541.1 hypothetical protein [Salmonella enterica subsp. enterica serovar Muenchen]EDM5739435.1 hypothetical protein [Salmonella enterica subsp. enterica serovar Muenchen]
MLDKPLNLSDHHRKSTDLVSGPGGFNRGVQRQNIGLERNAINHLDYSTTCWRDSLMSFMALTIALHGNIAHIHRNLVCLLCILRVPGHSGTEFLHRSRGFLQRSCLLFSL